LDKDTSGCLVLGRHRRSIAELGQLFKNSKINKIYWAVVSEIISDTEGVIDLPIGPKNPDDKRNWQMKTTPDGLPSLTYYKVLGQGGGLSLLELRPVTGRTHQLRVHCAAMGWSIMGDRIYGTAHENGLQLHARAITVPLYPKKDPITVVAPPPEHMLTALTLCGMCE
jgi:tRNA pseudouridine32 synthase/23S rRNA pseudouridine746 synthase